MESLCIKCKGKGLCGKKCKILSNFIDNAPKVRTHFSGSTPPEIFVGKEGYPNVFSGVLSPLNFGDTSIFSLPEKWVEKNLSIEKILAYRGQMIYGRAKAHIKSKNILTPEMQELAMSSKSTSVEFFLKKKPRIEFTLNRIFTIMANPAPIEKLILEEDTKIESKVDYLVSDYDVKAGTAIQELYDSRIIISNIQKILSAGLIGLKTQRKLVPTRWSITAIDDILSKNLIAKIRNYPELHDILLFNQEYNGNHYEILLLPDKFSFEVIEAEIPGNIWNPSEKLSFMQDYESSNGRKNYANNVTGAYYANRLAVCEFLNKINKQASVLILREIYPEYYAPLGVGILRELTRKAFLNKPEIYENLSKAIESVNSRLKINVQKFLNLSKIVQEYKKQTKLSNWV